MTSFEGIRRASDALGAARYGLEVTGQNIANADTPGYTRQVAQQTAVGAPAGVPSIHVRQVGTGGVRVAGTDRLADPVLNARVRTEHARSAAADTTASGIADLEGIFAEPSDDGLGEQLSDFWNAWGAVANDPGAAVPRDMLLQAAGTIVTTLHTMSAALDTVAQTAAGSLQAQVSAANAAAQELAGINPAIAIGAATGANVNALLDRRDQLLDTLSRTVGGVAALEANGTATVTVGSQQLVSGNTANPLVFMLDDSDPHAVTAQVTVGGNPVSLSTSAAAADVTAVTVTVPDYRRQLDQVADALAGTVNARQAAGYALDGTAGGPMFSGSGAAGITVAFTAGARVAAGVTPGTLDGSNALDASHGGTDPNGPDTLYGGLVGALGMAGAAAKQRQATQASITAGVDSLQAGVSGVSYDEEVSTMLTYQTAFQASSRVLTTLDSMLDTLINHTGLVGLT